MMRASLVNGLLLTGGLLWSREVVAACDGDPDCTGGPARIMIVLDTSSELLNDGNAAATMGNTVWDVIREVIAGSGDSLYDAPVEPPGPVASQVVHFGLAVIGDAAGGDGRLLLNYAPCSEPRTRWALDPLSSCVAPGCTDPWAGPPITWTSQDGSEIDPPGFIEQTLSHMPACDGNGNRCEGSDRFVAPGLEVVRTNLSSYPILTPFTQDDTTRYVNVLILTGEYADADVDVQSALEGSVIEGITTYVVAYGAVPMGVYETQLMSMAQWGSQGTLTYRHAANSGELANQLDQIVAELDLPCCGSIDCSHVGGADGGDGTAGDDAGADWGGLDGTAGDGTDSMSAGSGDASAGLTDSSGEIDDDGGCTCRADAPAGWAGVLPLVLLGLRRRSDSRA